MPRRLPVWFLALIVLLLDAGIGYVDYITGDYAMVMFYVIPIALAAWFLGARGAWTVSLMAGCTRYISDYSNYSSSNDSKLNSIEDLLYLLIFGLLLSAVKRLLDEEEPDSRRQTPTDKRVGQSVF